MSWVGRIASVLHLGELFPRDAKVLEDLPGNRMRVTYHGRREEVVTLGEEAMLLHRNGYPCAYTLRAPTGFAHAILCDQGDSENCWLVVDVYGPMEMTTWDEVKHWIPVYVPDHDRLWEQRHGG